MGIRIGLITALLAFGSLSFADDNRIPLQSIGALPKFQSPMLSPDGMWVAARMVDRGQSVVVVQRFETDDSESVPPAILRFGEKQIAWYDWANNERLILGVRATTGNYQRKHNVIRMFSASRDGTDIITIKTGEREGKGISRGSPIRSAYVINWLENDPDHILAALSIEGGEWNEPRVHKVNVNNGKRELVQRNNSGFSNWVADKDGELRAGARYQITLGRADVEIFHRIRKGEPWIKLQDTDFFSNDRIIPYRFDDDDPNILLVTTRELSRETLRTDELSGLHRYDLSQQKIIGEYTNPDYRRLVDTVKNAFPEDTVSLISHSKDFSRSFFRVYSDVRSPEFYLLDTNDRKLDYIAAEYPELVNYTLAHMTETSYKSRDGLEIPAFLTVPVSSSEEPRPLVVMPHGGPWAHDEWGFDNYVQLLANRGYLVLQPQFRGSTGFGVAHEEAGYGEWGMAIQDDITDGVQWLIESGQADPERICIVGASFGGYAAAMGLVRTPDLYACGVSLNGVLDLELLLDDELGFSRIRRSMFNKRRDISTTSPLEQTKVIKAPMLIIGSDNDTVVPVRHSQRMYKKLRKTSPESQYIELENAEHWRTSEKAELQVLTAVDEFLARYLDGTQAN